MDIEKSPQSVLTYPAQNVAPVPAEIGESASSSKGLKIMPLVRTMRRKIVLIVGISGSIFTLALVSALREPPVYEGNFQLLVEPITSAGRATDPTSLTRGDRGIPGREAFSMDYPTQLRILQGSKMMAEIIALVRTRYPSFHFGELRRGLVVERVGKDFNDQTKLLEIRFSGLEPDKVQFVLEKIAERYMRYSLDERKSRISEGVRFITDQEPELRRRVQQLQQELQRFQQSYRLFDPRVQGEQIFSQLRQVSNAKLETQREINEQRALYENLRAQLALTPNEALAASDLSLNPRYQDLQTKLKQLESQIAIESARFSPESPNLQALLDARDNLRAFINQETEQILANRLGSPSSNVLAFQSSTRIELINKLTQTDSQLQILNARIQELDTIQRQFEQQSKDFPLIASQHYDLQRRLELATRTLDQLLIQKETLQVEAAQNQVPWELVSKPALPRDGLNRPVPDPRDSRRKLMIGLGAGLFFGLLSAFLIEHLRNIFYVMDDVEDAAPFPFLGSVPVIPESLLPDRSVTLAGLPPWKEATPEALLPTAELTAVNDSFNQIYAALRFLYDLSPIQSMVVGSPQKGDGKSLVALFMAWTIAETGKRVLLVDASLQSPSLHHWLGLSESAGLGDLLATPVPPDEYIQSTRISPNLSFLSAGLHPGQTTRLLASEQMLHLAATLADSYDVVIYDSPALSDSLDARFLINNTDGLLMVVGVRKTARSVTQEIIKELNRYGLNIIGLLANHPPYQSEVLTAQGIHSSFGKLSQSYQNMQKQMAEAMSKSTSRSTKWSAPATSQQRVPPDPISPEHTPEPAASAHHDGKDG